MYKIEEFGDPCGLAAFHAMAVKKFAGADEEGEAVAQFFEFAGEVVGKGERTRGNPPFLLMEKPALRQ